jgi:hypothetical protein
MGSLASTSTRGRELAAEIDHCLHVADQSNAPLPDDITGQILVVDRRDRRQSFDTETRPDSPTSAPAFGDQPAGSSLRAGDMIVIAPDQAATYRDAQVGLIIAPRSSSHQQIRHSVVQHLTKAVSAALGLSARFVDWMAITQSMQTVLDRSLDDYNDNDDSISPCWWRGIFAPDIKRGRWIAPRTATTAVAGDAISIVAPAWLQPTDLGSERSGPIDELRAESLLAHHLAQPLLPSAGLDRQALLRSMWVSLQPDGLLALSFDFERSPMDFDELVEDLLEASLGRVLTQQIIVHDRADGHPSNWMTAICTRLGPSIKLLGERRGSIGRSVEDHQRLQIAVEVDGVIAALPTDSADTAAAEGGGEIADQERVDPDQTSPDGPANPLGSLPGAGEDDG